MHQSVGQRRHFSFEQFRDGLSGFLLRPLPLREVQDLAALVEDSIKLLDSASNSLRRGRRPDKEHAVKLAQVLRFLADQLEP